MYTIKALLFLAVVIISYVSAECYTNGAAWGNGVEKAELQAEFSTMCRTLTGTHLPGMTAQQCGRIGQLKHDFEVMNIGSKTSRLTNKQCQRGVSALLNRCERGGTSTMDTWFFKARAASGECQRMPSEI